METNGVVILMLELALEADAAAATADAAVAADAAVDGSTEAPHTAGSSVSASTASCMIAALWLSFSHHRVSNRLDHDSWRLL
jgi:hypothetical protein